MNFPHIFPSVLSPLTLIAHVDHHRFMHKSVANNQKQFVRAETSTRRRKKRPPSKCAGTSDVYDNKDVKEREKKTQL